MKYQTAFLAVLISQTALAGTSANNVVSGTISNVIPLAAPAKPQSVSYPAPGQIMFATDFVCGDGDVSSYASRNPGWKVYDIGKYGTTGKVTVVMGYWVASDTVASANSQLPTSSNFFPIAYTQPTADSDGNTVMMPAGRKIAGADDQGSSSSFLYQHLKALREASTNAYVMPGSTAATEPKVQLYAGVMGCIDPIDPTALAPSATIPVAAELLAGFVGTTAPIPSSISSAITGDPLTQKKLKLSFAPSTSVNSSNMFGTLSVTTGGDSLADGVDVTSDPLYVMAAALLASSSSTAGLSQLASDLKTKTSCEAVGGASVGTLWYDPIGIQAVCASLNGDGVADKITTHLTTPSDTLKAAIGLSLVKAAFIKKAMLQASAQYTASGLRCFGAPGKYWENVRQSFVFNLTPDNGQMQAKMDKTKLIHPEGFYAISQYRYYQNASTGDLKTVFNMGVDSDGGTPSGAVALQRGSSSNPQAGNSLSGAAVKMDFTFSGLNGCAAGKPTLCTVDKNGRKHCG